MYFGPLPKRYLPTYEGTTSDFGFKLDKLFGGFEAVTLDSCCFISFAIRIFLASLDCLDSPGRLRLIIVGFFNSYKTRLLFSLSSSMLVYE
jgi:hypothetical protein